MVYARTVCVLYTVTLSEYRQKIFAEQCRKVSEIAVKSCFEMDKNQLTSTACYIARRARIRPITGLRIGRVGEGNNIRCNKDETNADR